MRIAARIALVAGVLVMLALTLSPHNNRTQARIDHAVARARKQLDVPDTKPVPAQRRESDVIGNVLLFVPLGFLGLLAFPNRAVAVAASGPAASVAIEVFQGLYLPHRTASIRDVLANSTGHFAGMAAGAAVIAAAHAIAQRGQGLETPDR